MNTELHHGNCLEVMASIPDESIDLILCDLPYGTTCCSWDSVIPFEPLWEQYERVIKKMGQLYCSLHNHFRLYLQPLT